MSTAVDARPQAGLGPAPGPRTWLVQGWAVTRLELLRLRRGRFAWARVLLVFSPVLLAAAWAASMIWLAGDSAFSAIYFADGTRHTSATTLQEIAKFLWPAMSRFVLFLATLELFGQLVRSELAERTLHHLYLQPVRREVIVAGKYAAAVIALSVLAIASWTATLVLSLLPHGPGTAASTLLSGEGLRQLALYSLMIVLSIMAYGALFLAAGTIARIFFVVGFVVWVWETITLVLPQVVKHFTITYWVSSLTPLRVTSDNMLEIVADPAHPLLAVLVPCVIAAAFVAVASWRARNLELSYGATE